MMEKQEPIGRDSIEFRLAKVVLRKITGDQDGPDRWMERWLEPHRHYHGMDHFVQMCNDIDDHVRPDIFLAITFHDIIYDPKRQDNEERSRDYFQQEMPEDFKRENPKLMEDVSVAIMETKHIEPPKSELGKLICIADMKVLLESDIDGLIQYELKLSREYQTFPHELYRKGRIDFLSKWADLNSSIKELIEFVRHRRLNIGIYAGSFDPFTIGHQNILHKAERIFDKVIIARGLNPAKAQWTYKLPPSLDHHQKVYVGVKSSGMDPHAMVRAAGNDAYELDCHPHLAHVMLEHPDAVLVRGLRGFSDLEAEKTQQIYVERMLGKPLNAVYITCDREFDHISSSAFRQLLQVDPAMAAACCSDGMPQ